MKFDVLNRYTGMVQFTAEIDCAEDVPISRKLRLAVLWAVEHKADLSEANLSGADLSEANLSGANLRRADLSRADLSEANLRRADLSGADLRGADLRGANLSEANLSGADLRGADLSGADLSEANLSGANLRGADLRRADLSEANLRRADLSGADLSGADLRGAKNLAAPVSFGPVGNDLRYGYAVWDDGEVMVRLGCFYDTEKAAIKAVSKKYGARSGYVAMVRGACKVARERKVLNPVEAA